jgi:hypothetical protein
MMKTPFVNPAKSPAAEPGAGNQESVISSTT